MTTDERRMEIIYTRQWMQPGEFDYSGFGLGHFKTETGELVWGNRSEFRGRITRTFDTLYSWDRNERNRRVNKILSTS